MHVVTWVLLPPLLALALYLGAKSTVAYGKAARFVSRDARVVALIGAVKKVDFCFWHGFTYSGNRAGFSFQTTTGKGDFVVDVRLQRKRGAWCVEDANIRASDGSETYFHLH